MVNLAVIPARKGSKGIPNKNMVEIAGKPLLEWTISAALKSKSVDIVAVSTDDPKAKELSKELGAETIDRPKELAGDNVHAVHVVINCLDFYEKKGIIIEKVFMLLPTAPLRTSEDIDKASKIMDDYGSSSVVGVVKSNKPVSNYRTINDEFKLSPIIDTNNFEVQRQDINKAIYEVNGAMFVATFERLKANKSFHKGNPSPYIMPKERSVDVNDATDLTIAEVLLWQRQK